MSRWWGLPVVVSGIIKLQLVNLLQSKMSLRSPQTRSMERERDGDYEEEEEDGDVVWILHRNVWCFTVWLLRVTLRTHTKPW